MKQIKSDVSGRVAPEHVRECKHVDIKVRSTDGGVISGQGFFDYHMDDDPDAIREHAHEQLDETLRRAGLIEEGDA